MATTLTAPLTPWWIRLWRAVFGGADRDVRPREIKLPPPVIVPPPAPGPKLEPVRGPWEWGELPPSGNADAVRPVLVGRLWYAVSEAPAEDRPFLERLARDLDASTIEFPLFPDAALRLDRFLRSGDPTVTSVAAIVRNEPELVRRIWDAGNGAAYGRRAAKTLDEAIVRLGLDAVWRVVMGACVHSPVFRVRTYQPACDEIRAASPIVGTVANALCPGGEAWLAGILHDIGRLFVYRVASARRREQPDPLRVHNHALRLSPGIGMLIAANWGLRPGVVQSLAYLPDPAQAPIEHREAALAVKAAVVAVYQVSGAKKGLDYGAHAAMRILPTRSFTPEQAIAEAEKAWAAANPRKR